MVLNRKRKFFWSFLFFWYFSIVESFHSHYFRKHGPVMVIDNDGGGDDAMAIFIALLYQEHFHGPPVIGLSTVNGNVNETQAYINAQRILDVARRRNVPIYRGAEKALVVSEPTDNFYGKDGLGDLENVSYKAIRAEPLQSALALIQLSKQYEGDLIVVAIGPLTNIALAIKLDPGFINRTKQLYVGAGNLYDENYPLSTDPEFNVYQDVESYRVVADNAVPSKVTVINYSQIRKSFNITTEWRTNVLGAIPTKIMKALNEFERVEIPKSDLWQLLDPSVMAIVLDDSIVKETLLTRNNVILCGDRKGDQQRGTTFNDFNVEKGNMNFVYSASEEKFKEFLMKVFSSELPDY